MFNTVEMSPGAAFEDPLRGWRLEINEGHTVTAYRIGPGKREEVSLEEAIGVVPARVVREILAKGKAEAERRVG